MSIVLLAPLLLFGLIVLGGVIGLVILRSNRRARTVAVVLLSILGVVVVFAVVVFVGLFFAVHRTHRDWTEVVDSQPFQEHEWAAVGARAEVDHRALASQTGSDSQLSAEPPRANTTPPSASESNQDADPVVASPMPNDSPEWLGGKSTWTRENAYWARVRVGPYPRDEDEPGAEQPLPRTVAPEELRAAVSRDPLLREMFLEAVHEAVAQYTAHFEPEQPVRIELPASFILNRLVAEAWQSAAPGPDAIPLEPAPEYGHLVDLHLLLKFDAGVRGDISTLLREKLIETRIGALGRALLVLLAVLGALFLYLKTWRPPAPRPAG